MDSCIPDGIMSDSPEADADLVMPERDTRLTAGEIIALDEREGAIAISIRFLAPCDGTGFAGVIGVIWVGYSVLAVLSSRLRAPSPTSLLSFTGDNSLVISPLPDDSREL